MEITETVYCATRAEWRRWLAKHHASKREIWLIYYKKGSGKPRVEYGDAVEEALCYGWIDGIGKGIDAEKYAQRFSPRRKGSDWSPSNLERIKRLVANGLMTAAGRVHFPTAAEAREHRKAHAERLKGMTDRRKRGVPAPPELSKALKSNKKAAAFFEALAPGYKLRYCGWVGVAKQAETRERRAREAVKQLSLGVKSLLK